MSKFMFEVELGNAAMQTTDDVGEALTRVADKLLHDRGPDWSPHDTVAERVRDVNGNTVGKWWLSELPDSPYCDDCGARWQEEGHRPICPRADQTPGGRAMSRSAPAARCFAPHPADESARCCLREGHGGPHLAQGETWPAAHPEPDRAPEQTIICDRCGQRLPFDITIEHYCSGPEASAGQEEQWEQGSSGVGETDRAPEDER